MRRATALDLTASDFDLDSLHRPRKQKLTEKKKNIALRLNEIRKALST